MLASTSTRAESACHTTAEQKPLEVRVYQITWRSSSLSLSLSANAFYFLVPIAEKYLPPIFPLLLCLATCGTQPLQYPAVHQTKSGMRNILRLPANSYENMLRPNLKQFAMANNTHWLTDPCRAQQAEHSTARARACSLQLLPVPPPPLPIPLPFGQSKCLSKIWQTGAHTGNSSDNVVAPLLIP